MSYPSLATPPTGASVVAATAPHRPEAAEAGTTRASAVDHRRGRRRPCPGGDADLHRLLRHRPAAPAAVGVGRADLDRDDGRRGRDARRAMGPDPAARPRPARADPVGRADRRRRAWSGTDASRRSVRDHDRLRGRLARLRLHPSRLHRRRVAGRAAGRAGRRRRRDHLGQRHQLCARAGARHQPLRWITTCRSPPSRCCCSAWRLGRAAGSLR